MVKSKMTIQTLGWTPALQKSFAGFYQNGFEPARVAVEDKHYYVVFTAEASLSAQVTGKVLHAAGETAELPKVGDWVAVKSVPEENKAVIHHVLPRRSKLSRKVAGRETEEQVLVTNVDTAFIVQALDRSFNPLLLQRHLLMVRDGGVRPVIVLNKVDLCDDVPARLAAVAEIGGGAQTLAVSAKTGRAMDRLAQLVQPGETIVFIGPSGVGKSSIINRLLGEEAQTTTEVRASDGKGRHTTTWRELIVLPNGGLVIDTPGMREFQMWLADEGVHETFPEIEALSAQCHFSNCGHTREKGCAVLAAVEQGALPRARHEGFVKLQREQALLGKAAQRRQFQERIRKSRAARRILNESVPEGF